MQVKERLQSNRSEAKEFVVWMRRSGIILVVFDFFKTVKKKKKRVKTLKILLKLSLRWGRKRSQALTVQCELSRHLWQPQLKPFATWVLPTAGNWEMSLNTAKLHVRTGCAVDNLCSIKPTTVGFKKDRQSILTTELGKVKVWKVRGHGGTHISIRATATAMSCAEWEQGAASYGPKTQLRRFQS